jgi:hypothetical protein
MAVRMQGRIGWDSEPGRYVCCGTHEGYVKLAVTLGMSGCLA